MAVECGALHCGQCRPRVPHHGRPFRLRHERIDVDTCAPRHGTRAVRIYNADSARRARQRPPAIGPVAMKNRLVPAACLPVDHALATLVGRVWSEREGGPVLVAVRGDDAVSTSRASRRRCAISSSCDDPVAAIRARRRPAARRRARRRARQLAERERDPHAPWLLAPCDLQAIKAAGVTFVASMLERVIEEQARGDPAQARGRARARSSRVIGDNLARGAARARPRPRGSRRC